MSEASIDLARELINDGERRTMDMAKALEAYAEHIAELVIAKLKPQDRFPEGDHFGS